MTDAKIIKMSRRAAKTIHADTRARVNQMTSGHERLKEYAADLQHKLHSTNAALEAMVRRHGPQVFDRMELENLVGSNCLTADITDDRVTFKLKDA